jgi:hypothetical protein
MSRFSFIILFLWCLNGLQTNPIIKTSQQLCQTLVLSYKGILFSKTFTFIINLIKIWNLN